MRKKYWMISLAVAFITFILGTLLFVTIDSPSPFIGALVVAFLLFEIIVYHLFGKEKQNNKLP
ncbi:hypothetical protein EQV77_06680 [Halobacillus fulvus]|nr:hypothetical protein EQV77_06680 [Halobacillus fulvus]